MATKRKRKRPADRISANGSTNRTVNSLDDLQPITRKVVSVTHHGATYWIRSLDALEFTRLQSRVNEDQYVEGKFLLVAYCLVNEDGQRIVADDQIARLYQLEPELINKLFLEASRLTVPEGVEELEGN